MQILKLTKLSLLLLCISVTRLKSVKCYSQIAISGSNAANEGPKIYKAMNMDLIFPKTFNSSENVISTTTAPTTTTTVEPSVAMTYERPALFVTPANMDDNAATPPSPIVSAGNVIPQQLQPEHREQQMYASTGRAVNYHPTYPFSQLLTQTNQKNLRSRPAAVVASRPASGINRIVYPNSYANQQQRRPPSRAEFGNLNGKSQLIDRFSPSEGVASHKFKSNHDHHHHHYPTGGNDIRVAAPSNQVVTSYKPPKNLYSFPPNLNAVYPAPAKDPKTALPSNSITSYLPPPSGPLSNGALNGPGYLYMPPTSPAAPVMMPASSGGYTYPGPIAPPTGTADSNMPPSEETKAADDGNGDGGADTDDSGNDDTIGVLPASAMDTAGDGGADDMKSMMTGGGGGDDAMPAGMDMGMNDHDHPLTGYDSDKEYPTPPPGWLDDHPESAHDHPHDHDHDHPVSDHDHPHDHDFPSYPVWSGPSYSDIIYDDHFHHHHHPEPLPATLPPEPTIPPPVELPPEPRVKKYSYFYIGRKLWYIPLYFTVWFSFYVLWLILKSIARHKVNLPNHYVNRRSLPEYTTPQRTKEYIDKLTVAVLSKIDGFKDKYL